MSYEEIAVLVGKPSADAARMAIQRSLHRLAVAMKKISTPGRTS
jgi:hypothetical protein